MKFFFHTTLIAPLISFLKQGLSPEKLALSIAFGVAFGIFPVIGVTTLLCTLAVLVIRLNMPATQLINYFVTPLQLILLIPFVRLGEFLFNEPTLPLNVLQILGMIRSDLFGAVNFLWWTTLHAIVAWMFIGPVLIGILYYILVPIFTHLSQQIAEE
ncbi:MAG: DUF2062 domain-containing protein [Bacteroidota bacterium]|nr:DUF2062 domain-containing protein [Bacteroidota bacterium]